MQQQQQQVRKKQTKVQTMPINLLFDFFQKKTPLDIWLHDNTDLRMEGILIGFDEYMNLTIDNAVEVYLKTNKRRDIGRILLKGDNIAVVRSLQIQ